MRNLGYLRLYTRWYLEDTEIYRSLVSAWENNTMLRRVDIYTTLPIVNAYDFAKSVETSMECLKKSTSIANNGMNDIYHNSAGWSLNLG